MSVTPNRTRLGFYNNSDVVYLNVTYTGGMTYEHPVITYTGTQSGWLSCISEQLIESDDVDVVRYGFRSTPYTNAHKRTATITFEDSTGTAQVSAVQAGTLISLWMGWTNMSFEDNTHIRIWDFDRDKVIFEGITAGPGFQNINQIVKDYISSVNMMMRHHQRLDVYMEQGCLEFIE